MPLTTTQKTRLADLGLLYAAAIWGATFFIVKDALSGIDAVTMVAYRFLIAGGLLLIYLLKTGRHVMENFRYSVPLAIMLWFLYVPQTLGLKYTSASNSGFITGLFVAFVPLFLLTIFKRRPTVMEVVASAISLIGLWILTGGLHYVNLGDALTLVAAVAYALHLLYADRYMKRGFDPYVFSCQQFLLNGLLALFTSLIIGLPLNITTDHAFWTVIFLAVFPTLSAFLIQMVAQKITSPLRVSLVFALEPVFAAAFAWTIGGEQVVLRRAAGGLLIAVALALSGLPTPSFLKRRTGEPA
ncbi:MAG: DMT family transporter [candidate division Zixibacteria bacterium]|jgi:drug/metabolite transporter (DMT)-like permease|nr:DMT family transporter [candidate division Zixibacteria bacterium]